jgi:hypothetical protein
MNANALATAFVGVVKDNNLIPLEFSRPLSFPPNHGKLTACWGNAPFASCDPPERVEYGRQ